MKKGLKRIALFKEAHQRLQRMNERPDEEGIETERSPGSCGTIASRMNERPDEEGI